MYTRIWLNHTHSHLHPMVLLIREYGREVDSYIVPLTCHVEHAVPEVLVAWDLEGVESNPIHAHAL